MGTFLIGFGILQTLQVLSKMPGRIPALVVDRIIKDVPPKEEKQKQWLLLKPWV
jgi:hypothetical protein